MNKVLSEQLMVFGDDDGYEKLERIVLECIKDGWYPLIRTALWLIIASGVAMALTAGRSRRKKEVAS